MTTEREHPTMNDQQINDMVSRFLAWRLPEDFNPDGGISFAPTYNTWGGGTARAEPVGTNLFSFDQAKQMVLHMLGEANSPAPDPAAIREAALQPLLDLVEEFVTATWHLLDNSETSGPVNDPTITVWQPDFDEVSKLLDRCEGLPSGSTEHMTAGELLVANILALIPKGAAE